MLKGKDVLSIQSLTVKDMFRIFERAKQFKKRPFSTHLKGKTLVMVFAKPSTRTRVSFEVGINQMGGDDVFLPMDELQFSRGESIEDTSRVLARYGDGIIARLFKHENLVRLAEHSSVPVINGLTDLLHPCQGLTDLFTVWEKLGKLRGKRMVFVGDGNNNVTHSLLHACSKLGVDLRIACPPGYRPNAQVVKNALNNARSSGASVEVMTDPRVAVKGADVVYTDTWVSMGLESEERKREKAFRRYQVNRGLLAHARNSPFVMHDLPAHRGKEITSEVMDSKQSIIFDQAENRMHVEKALLSFIYPK